MELIKSVDNIPVVGGKYKTDITLPEGRDGNDIFFVRWQRDDPRSYCNSLNTDRRGVLTIIKGLLNQALI